MESTIPKICVFCGSAAGTNPLYAEAARQLGHALVHRGWGLVYGGGHVGLMGILADAVLNAGGEVVGVIPQGLIDRELAHPGVADMRVVQTMHERKALMADLSDAFLALPGGFGTADETFEMLTWAQLKIHHKPIGLLNMAGYFDPLLAWIDRAIEEGFIKLRYRSLFTVEKEIETILQSFAKKLNA